MEHNCQTSIVRLRLFFCIIIIIIIIIDDGDNNYNNNKYQMIKGMGFVYLNAL